MNKDTIVINMIKGSYFYDSDEKLYFLEKKYISKSFESVQIFVILILYIIVSNASNYFVMPYIEDTIMYRFIVSLGYILLFVILLKIVLMFTEKKEKIYNIKCKVVVDNREKRQLVFKLKKIVVFWSVLTLIMSTLAIWMQFIFISGEDLGVLLDASMSIAAVIVCLWSMEFNFIKFYHCLLKDVMTMTD